MTGPLRDLEAVADQWDHDSWMHSNLRIPLRHPLVAVLTADLEALRAIAPTRLRGNSRPHWIALMHHAFPDAGVTVPPDQRGVIDVMAAAWLDYLASGRVAATPTTDKT